MSSPSLRAGIWRWWGAGEAGSPPPTPASSPVSSFHPPDSGMHARGSLHPPLPTLGTPLYLFVSSLLFHKAPFVWSFHLLLVPSKRETGMRAEEELKSNPLEGERWKCQGIHLSSLRLSHRHLFKMHPNFTLVFLLPFNLINCVDISSLYIWGKSSVHFKLILSIWKLWSCPS